MTDWEAQRHAMVTRQLASRDITDDRVLDAMAAVPRHRFLSPGRRHEAYADRPLPIGSGQTISQPYIVALMAQAAEVAEDNRVLEIGCGSGYGAAVLGRLAAEVWTIERHEDLAESALDVLGELGVTNVHVVVGDGTLGLASEAPFDAIVVTAGAPSVPERLIEQLAAGGRLVVPVAHGGAQLLERFRKTDTGIERDDLGGVRFVPLIGAEGYPERGRH